MRPGGGPSVRAGADRLVAKPLEQAYGFRQPEVVWRGKRAADVREQRAVAADEREVGLRVAAVDREDDRLAHRAAPASDSASSARRLSSSAPESSSCPISGWVRSAFRAVTGSRVTAASAVSRS